MNTAIAEDGLESLSRDPYLALSLEGIRLIEASAGTGKTFTLATLFTRLVVEQGLRIGQILAVTFTDAATQELRKRIRERLALAARLVDMEAADGEAPEVRLTRDVLQRHLQGGTESAAALKRRLQVAADEIDLASIFTIHGFCTRVLREHALESGHTFDPPELLASDRELLEELAADLWRVHANDPATLEPLTWLWSSPDALAADLRALLGTPPLHPLPRPAALADPRPALQSAAEALSASVREHGEQFFIDLWAGSCWPGPSATIPANCWPANACRHCCRTCWPTRPTRSLPIGHRRRPCRHRWRVMSRCWPNAMPGCGTARWPSCTACAKKPRSACRR